MRSDFEISAATRNLPLNRFIKPSSSKWNTLKLASEARFEASSGPTVRIFGRLECLFAFPDAQNFLETEHSTSVIMPAL